MKPSRCKTVRRVCCHISRGCRRLGTVNPLLYSTLPDLSLPVKTALRFTAHRKTVLGLSLRHSVRATNPLPDCTTPFKTLPRLTRPDLTTPYLTNTLPRYSATSNEATSNRPMPILRPLPIPLSRPPSITDASISLRLTMVLSHRIENSHDQPGEQAAR